MEDFRPSYVLVKHATEAKPLLNLLCEERTTRALLWLRWLYYNKDPRTL